MVEHLREVLREYPAVGKYKIRLLKSSRGTVDLDVREYVSGETFEGFTRRGVVLRSSEEIQALMDVLATALKDMALRRELDALGARREEGENPVA